MEGETAVGANNINTYVYARRYTRTVVLNSISVQQYAAALGEV